MDAKLLLFFVLISLALAVSRPSLSCSSMKKNPIWSKFKCYLACQAINCSTGECEMKGSRPTCVCSCKKGPIILDILDKFPMGKIPKGK